MVYTSGNTSQTAKYIYGSSDEPIGMVITDSNNSINNYYYLRNAQGDITGIVNSSGKKIISYTYDVFGNCTETYHSTTTTENTNYLKVNVLNPFAYRGYCYDADMGLYYLQSRYYDPNTGRFINADDTNYLNATGTVLGCNLFAYCENDPINYSDNLGNFSIKKVNETLVKLLSNIKSSFFEYIKSLFKNNKGEFAIHTDVIAIVINTAIKIVLSKALVSSANSVLTVVSKTYLKTHTGDAIKVIKKIIDFLTKNKAGKTIMNLLAKAVVKAFGFKSGLLSTLLGGMISNLIKIKSNLINKVSIILTAFSSIGNFLAFVLFDLVDKKMDSYFSINAMRKMVL